MTGGDAAVAGGPEVAGGSAGAGSLSPGVPVKFPSPCCGLEACSCRESATSLCREQTSKHRKFRRFVFQGLL